MSLVTTTRSQRSRIVLHSISTSVVLPEPTGPPTPTRSGGSFLVRRAMAWRLAFMHAIMHEARQCSQGSERQAHRQRCRVAVDDVATERGHLAGGAVAEDRK